MAHPPTPPKYPIVLSSPIRSLTPSEHYSTPSDIGELDPEFDFENQTGYYNRYGWPLPKNIGQYVTPDKGDKVCFQSEFILYVTDKLTGYPNH
jgi:hypothetical protein